MSEMLEKAIIDAQALRTAAVKNAETLVLEKFSGQIKEAVESLLEQEEAPSPEMPGLGDMEDPFSQDEQSTASSYEESSVMAHIPVAATLESDDVVEIPLDKLTEEIDALKKSLLSEEDTLEEENLEEDLEEDLDEGLEEEGIELEEGALQEIVEELIVDMKPQKTGWMRTPASVLELAEEELLALEQDSKVREERAAMRDAAAKMKITNESLSKKNNDLTNLLEQKTLQIEKLKEVTMLLKEKLETTNLSKAKLLYQNKALNSDSLNERQKQKLVEAVSNAETVEEAKVIFDTLQSTVGSTSRKSRPKSLGEAVQKQPSMILSAGRERAGRQKDNPTYDRWKFLAGIDKN